jgi:hypothetical protein
MIQNMPSKIKEERKGGEKMKKTLISIVPVAFVALMITNVYAISVPAPVFCEPRCPGFTPGFWKHNIRVYLGETNGKYSAFEGGPLDGVKLTDDMMDDLLDIINAKITSLGYPALTFEDALNYLKGPGWSADRTNTANCFNWAAGYGAY